MPNLTLAVLLFLGSISTTFAQGSENSIILRLHQPIPSFSHVPSGVLTPWGDRLEAESGGRVIVEHYPSMQLGGTPANLYDQAADGVVDIVWTVLGYTPGRFPISETFEQPFLMHDTRATSCGFHRFMEAYGQEEFADVKVLAWHTQSSQILFSSAPIRSHEDILSKKVRVGSSTLERFFSNIGVSSMPGMPIGDVAAAFSTGVIDVAPLSWGLGPSYGLNELVDYNTELNPRTNRGWYTQTFAMVMNQESFDKLPADIQAIINSGEMSGPRLAVELSQAMAESDVRGRDNAIAMNNTLITISGDALEPWLIAGRTTRQQWVVTMAKRGYDGDKLLSAASRAIESCEATDWIQNYEPIFVERYQ